MEIVYHKYKKYFFHSKFYTSYFNKKFKITKDNLIMNKNKRTKIFLFNSNKDNIINLEVLHEYWARSFNIHTL